MKGNRRGSPPAVSSVAAAAAPPPTSPPAKGTAKYTNKDGSKFITVPKALMDSYPPSTSQASSPVQSAPPQGGIAGSVGSDGPAPTVNRKKAKRRAKLAAARDKAEADVAADVRSNVNSLPAAPSSNGQQWSPSTHADDDGDASGDEGMDNASAQTGTEADKNGISTNAAKSKKAKKKKKKKDTTIDESTSAGATAMTAHPSRSGAVASKEKIWNTNSQEERRRIKDFWLDLSEEERKSLVKVEKDTVLRKMKEQQKMTCSCHFCGRKRTAIEEELEGLYDSYYEELEQYANDPVGRQNPPLMSSNRHLTASHVSHSHLPASAYSGQEPSRGQIIGHVGEDEDEHGEYEDDLDDESEGEEDGEPRKGSQSPEPFPFGNSLKVHGGILTVADDLLKNDGQKFITMMEQLAESRMAREEDARDRYSSRSGSFVQNGADGMHNHSHHAVSDEDNYSPEEDGDEEYDSPEEDYEDEEEVMTEAQRMEEGRRMFQIFAARMFEQRVLTAYREKVAKERQQKLLEELANEENQESQRKAKKAKEAQKRKDKAAQKRQALAEEKARRDAEKAAEEAERHAKEAQKADELRQKADEKRKKREAQKRAEEEERLRKEADRQRRIHEQKERQAEQERKTREAKERERKTKEEARLKEKDAQDKRERESRQRKDKDERGRRDREPKASSGDVRSRQKQGERTAGKAASAAPAAPVPAMPAIPTVPAVPAALSTPLLAPITLPKRPLQHAPAPGQPSLQQAPIGSGMLPALPHQFAASSAPTAPAGFASPLLPVATPVVPKAPTPMRARQTSQQGGSTTGSQSGGTTSRTASLSGSGQSQNASPHPMTPVQANVGAFGLAKPSTLASGLAQSSGGLGSNLPPAASPMSAPAQQSSPFSMAPSPVSMHYPLGIAPVSLPPGLSLPSQFGPISTGSFRNTGPPSMMQMPPGINGINGLGMNGINGLGSINGMNGLNGMNGINPMNGMNSLSRGFGPMVPPPPGFNHHMPQDPLGTPVGVPLSMDTNGASMGHGRQSSTGFELASSPASTAPISRPTPIGRPGSVVHGQHMEPLPSDNEGDNPHHLGSKALLDDSDFPLDTFPSRRSVGSARPFGTAPSSFGVDLSAAFGSPASLWGSAPTHTPGGAFTSGPPPGFPVPSMAPGGWGMPLNPMNPLNPSPFSSHSSLGRSTQGRSATLRQILCRACKELAASIEADSMAAGGEHMVPIEAVKSRVNALAQGYVEPVQDAELDMLYDTEGNGNNGGGNFEVQRDGSNAVTAIRWMPDMLFQPLGAPAPAVPTARPSEGNTAPIGAALIR